MNTNAAVYEPTPKQHKKLAESIFKIERDANWYNPKNGYCLTGPGNMPERLTIALSETNTYQESVNHFHTYSESSKEVELEFKITKVSEIKIQITMKTGELNRESIEVIIREVGKVQRKLRGSAYRKEKKLKGGPNTNNLIGYFAWRGSIDSSHEFWKNYKKAVDLGIASNNMIKKMKKWGLHLRNYNV